MVIELCLSFFFSAIVLALVLILLLVPKSSSDSGSSSGPTIDMGIELKALNASGEIPNSVMKGDKRAFEVLLKKGVLHGEGSNAHVKMRPGQFFPSESCRVKFKLWFDDAFQWTASSSHKVAGKLGGFKMGSGPASGGNYSTSGATFRLTFYRDKGAVAYLYPQLKQNFNGSPSWDLLDQDPSLVSQSYVAMGVHVFNPNRNPQLFFRMGGWNDVEMYCRLNTPGKYDGVMELTVNGQSRRLNTVRYRYTADLKIDHFLLSPFFGGGSQDYAPKTDIRLWYTDFAFGN